MNYTVAYKKIIDLLRDHSNEENAMAMQRYMQAQFSFFGIKSPLRKQLMKTIKEIAPPSDDMAYQALTTQLWNDPYRECQYIAQELVGAKVKHLSMEWINYIEWMIRTRSWWDTVDYIASTIIGGIFKRHPEEGRQRADTWITSDHMWLQRTAILYQLKYKDQVNEQQLYKYILQHRNSEEFFIQKAAGWALRQYSKYAPMSVSNFIFKYADLPKLTIKEGSKYL